MNIFHSADVPPIYILMFPINPVFFFLYKFTGKQIGFEEKNVQLRRFIEPAINIIFMYSFICPLEVGTRELYDFPPRSMEIETCSASVPNSKIKHRLRHFEPMAYLIPRSERVVATYPSFQFFHLHQFLHLTN